MCHRDADGWFFFDYRKGGGIRHNGDFVNAGFVEKAIAEQRCVSDVFVYGVPAASRAPGEKDVVAAIVPAADVPFDAFVRVCRLAAVDSSRTSSRAICRSSRRSRRPRREAAGALPPRPLRARRGGRLHAVALAITATARRSRQRDARALLGAAVDHDATDDAERRAVLAGKRGCGWLLVLRSPHPHLDQLMVEQGAARPCTMPSARIAVDQHHGSAHAPWRQPPLSDVRSSLAIGDSGR